MQIGSLSSAGRSAFVLTASASAIAFVAASSAIIKPRRRRAKRGEEIEVHNKQTERNEKILSASADLLSEPWGFSNCHVASILAQLRPSPFWGSWGQIVTRRIEKIATPEGGDIEVEFVEPLGMKQPPPTSVPIIILLHGINGHSREPYIEQAALHVAVQRRWRALILNYGKIRVGNDKMPWILGGYNVVDGGDLNFLISHLRKHHDGFIGAIGFSMGGAKLVQYLSRTREHCNIDAACTVSSVLDCTDRNMMVYRPDSIIQKAYHFAVASALKFWIVRNWTELKKHPKMSTLKPFQWTSSGLLWWVQSHRLTDIDNAFTIHARGYSDLNQYYNDATSVDRLRDGIKIPLLCLQAKNDPILPPEIIPGEDVAMDNENVFIVTTPRLGGHIGYWIPGRGCWATLGCLSFFDSVKQHATKRKSRILHQQSSLRAAHYLQRSSITKLTNYYNFVANDSCSDFLSEEYDPMTAKTGQPSSPSSSFDEMTHTISKKRVIRYNQPHISPSVGRKCVPSGRGMLAV